MDTVLVLTGAGVIVAAIGVATTVVIWVLKGVFNLGGLHMKVDALNDKVDAKVDTLTEKIDAKVDALTERVDARVDVLTERVDDLSQKVDDLADGQRALQGDLNRVIVMLTALANHRHDVDGNILFNVPPSS